MNSNPNTLQLFVRSYTKGVSQKLQDEQDRQCRYNVTSKRICATNVALEKR